MADDHNALHRWHATGGNGTAAIVSRIGGPAFAVTRHGQPDPNIAEMVAAALNGDIDTAALRADVATDG